MTSVQTRKKEPKYIVYVSNLTTRLGKSSLKNLGKLVKIIIEKFSSADVIHHGKLEIKISFKI